MGRKSKENLSFFTNAKGEIQYHKYCANCDYGKAHDCQQSYRCTLIICPKRER